VALVAVTRIRGALREADAAAPPGDAVEDWVRREVERSFPGVRVPKAFGYDAEPTTPHVRLGTLHIRSSLQHHRKMLTMRNEQYQPAYTAIIEMGGNAWVKERIDEVVPGLDPRSGELVETVYLLHAGEVPAELRPAFDGWACQVTEVPKGSPAEASGMVAGDLLMELNGGGQLAQAKGEDDRCAAVVGSLLALKPNEPGSLKVLRGGREVEFTIVRAGDRFGYKYMKVPVLESL
jgi:C-terminal processing protease CtpA/Prc